MSRCTLILVNLIIIPPLVCLVAEEVNGCIFYSRQILLRFQVLQAVGFIPSGGEDVKGYLSADRVAIDHTNGLVRCLKKKKGMIGGVAYVRPKSGNFSLSAATNLVRIWC